MTGRTPNDAAAKAVALIAHCRVELAAASADLEAARRAREGLNEVDVDLVVRADEAVRLTHCNRGIAQDRLDAALARLNREVPA